MIKYLEKIGTSLSILFFATAFIGLFTDSILKSFVCIICGSICHAGEQIANAIKGKEPVVFNLQNPTVVSENKK